MARRPTQPALYELIRPNSGQRALPPAGLGMRGGNAGSQGGGTGGYPPSVAAPPSAALPAPGGPGRFIKVPVGYAYISIAVGLAVMVSLYIYGYSAGERAAAKRFDEQRVGELTALTNLPDYDPMSVGKTPQSLQSDRPAAGPGPGSGAGPGAGPGAGQLGSGNGNGAAGNGPGSGPPSGPTSNDDLGPAPGGDPRVVGLNYFVVAHLPAQNGQPMVDFCRKNGLDAHLVPDDNRRLYLVIVCPGFAGGERQSKAVKALEAKIRSVGLKWRDAAKGNRDFYDAYPKKHK